MKFHITIVCDTIDELKAFTDSILIKDKTGVIRNLDAQIEELQRAR